MSNPRHLSRDTGSISVSNVRCGVQDPVHRLAWSLDACLKDRVLDEKRMRELHQFFVPLNRPSCKPPLPGLSQGSSAAAPAR